LGSTACLFGSRFFGCCLLSRCFLGSGLFGSGFFSCWFLCSCFLGCWSFCSYLFGGCFSRGFFSGCCGFFSGCLGASCGLSGSSLSACSCLLLRSFFLRGSLFGGYSSFKSSLFSCCFSTCSRFLGGQLGTCGGFFSGYFAFCGGFLGGQLQALCNNSFCFGNGFIMRTGKLVGSFDSSSLLLGICHCLLGSISGFLGFSNFGFCCGDLLG